MSRPLFSCVVPVKGERPFFDEAIASLRAQGMGEDLEIIVQDADVEPDEGQSDAFNKGFAKASGEWLFWLNADDVLLPGALRKVKEVVSGRRTVVGDKGLASSPATGHQPPTADSLVWIAGNVAYLDEAGKVIRCAWDRGAKYSYRQMAVQVYGPSSFFRRGLLEKIGPFDTSLNYTMDIDMWCRFRKAGYWYEKIPDLVWGFRVHDGSKTHEAQMGGWPKEIADEHKILDGRHSLRERHLDKRLAQISRLLNGSYRRSYVLCRKFRGCDWRELGGREENEG